MCLSSPPSSVEGRIYDPADPDRGVEGAEVAVETRPRVVDRSLLEGRFRVEIPSEAENEPLTLQVRKGGFNTFKQDFRFECKMAPIDIALVREAFVFRGVIVAGDQQGQPVEGAQVTLSLDPPVRVRTKSDGGFLFKIPQEYNDQFRSLRVEKEGYEIATGDFRLQQEGQQIEVTLEREQAYGLYEDGLSFMKEGKFRAAAEAFADANHQWGRALEEQDSFDQAVEKYRRATELDSNRSDYELALAQTLRALQNLQEATAHYERALEIKPDLFEACKQLADVLFDRGAQSNDTALVERAIETRQRCQALEEQGFAPSGEESPVPFRAQKEDPFQVAGIVPSPESNSLGVLKTLEGQVVPLEAFRGRVVLLTFWATWCGPCREQMALLESLYRQFEGEDFTVLAVSIGAEGPGPVRGFAEELNFTFPIFHDSQKELASQFGVASLPTTHLIDREGRVLGHVTGRREWDTGSMRALLKSLLDEGRGDG